MSFERPTGREVERVGFAQRVILAALALSVSLGSASASAEEGVDRAFAEVDVVERPGQRIPLDLTFLNEDGEAVDALIQVQENVVNVSPRAPLAPGTTYVVEVLAGGLADLSGNRLAETRRWSFTTAE